ncbi:MAG: hypothetical protein ACEQSR_14855 [Candidatus Methylacidiphilales bacterium]
MNKKYSYGIFVIIALLLFNSLFQIAFIQLGKSSTFHANQTVGKSKLLNGIKGIDCISEVEEDFNEDAPENNLQSIHHFDLFKLKLNNLLLVSSNYKSAPKNLFNNVPIHIALGIFRI